MRASVHTGWTRRLRKTAAATGALGCPPPCARPALLPLIHAFSCGLLHASCSELVELGPVYTRHSPLLPTWVLDQAEFGSSTPFPSCLSVKNLPVVPGPIHKAFLAPPNQLSPLVQSWQLEHLRKLSGASCCVCSFTFPQQIKLASRRL